MKRIQIVCTLIISFLLINVISRRFNGNIFGASNQRPIPMIDNSGIQTEPINNPIEYKKERENFFLRKTKKKTRNIGIQTKKERIKKKSPQSHKINKDYIPLSQISTETITELINSKIKSIDMYFSKPINVSCKSCINEFSRLALIASRLDDGVQPGVGMYCSPQKLCILSFIDKIFKYPLDTEQSFINLLQLKFDDELEGEIFIFVKKSPCVLCINSMYDLLKTHKLLTIRSFYTKIEYNSLEDKMDNNEGYFDKKDIIGNRNRYKDYIKYKIPNSEIYFYFLNNNNIQKVNDL